MEDEIALLKEKLAHESMRVVELEDECDLLAEDNLRLRLQVGDLEKKMARESHYNPGVGGDSNDGGDTRKLRQMDAELLLDGDDKYAAVCKNTVPNACGGGNILAVSYLKYTTPLVVCGGVDKTLRVYEMEHGVLMWSQTVSSPILTIQSHCLTTGESDDSSQALCKWVVGCGLMDGHSYICELHAFTAPPAPANPEDIAAAACPIMIISQLAESLEPFHLKYTVSVSWSGRFLGNALLLATASHDRTINFYQHHSGCADSASAVASAGMVRLQSIPECVVFVPVSSTSSIKESTLDGGAASTTVTTVPGDNKNAVELVVAMRDSCHLLYIHCRLSTTDAKYEFIQRLISLNENIWDLHVSFTPLFLCLSPAGDYLLVTHDKNAHFLVHSSFPEEVTDKDKVNAAAGAATHACRRVARFDGSMTGDYSKPRTSWDATGKYFYSTTQDCCDVHVYSVAQQKLVGVLSGHKGAVRDVQVLCTHDQTGNTHRTVASVSFDHSVKFWGNEH